MNIVAWCVAVTLISSICAIYELYHAYHIIKATEESCASYLIRLDELLHQCADLKNGLKKQ